MRLAKPCLDVGLSTNRLEMILAFYQRDVALELEEVLPLGGGARQHRHALNGSVLKINAAREPYPAGSPTGYRGLVIARDGLRVPVDLVDPDGTPIRLVPRGADGVTGIAIRVATADAAAQGRFYRDAFGMTEEGPGRFRCGDTLMLVDDEPAAPRDAQMGGVGFRYITAQVWDCDAEHRAVLAGGGREGRAPATLGAVARISFVRDPGGNWIEISQRASLTGALPA
jgi:lactoylglutathione lyase